MTGSAHAIETDAVIIGAGPVGLFQVFQLGLQEIKCHVIDALPHPGGQCVELYGDKPIYDIPGIPFCTGAQLVDQLLEQIKPFNAPFHLGQEVASVERLADGRFAVKTSKGAEFACKAVFVAAGVGAFQPRKLKIDGIEQFEGTHLHYHVREPGQFAGKHLVIVGADEAAVDWALRLSDGSPAGSAAHPANLVLLHRREVFNAPPGKVAELQARIAAQRVQFTAGQITGFEAAENKLTGLKVTGPDAVTRILPCDNVLVLWGLSPKLGPIADWGLALEHKHVVVNTQTFESSTPGIFAVGDINTYPGKKKLILCGFHEATLAAFGAAPIVHPERRVQLQYTTSSPKLHQLLGVESPKLED